MSDNSVSRDYCDFEHIADYYWKLLSEDFDNNNQEAARYAKEHWWAAYMSDDGL